MIVHYEHEAPMVFTPPIGPTFVADTEAIEKFYNFWMKNELTGRYEFYQAQLEMAKNAGDVEAVEKLITRVRDMHVDIFRAVVKWALENRTRVMAGKLVQTPGG